MCKKKLLVVVGAGASVEMGMPLNNDINHKLSKIALENNFYYEEKGQKHDLYTYIKDKIKYSCRIKNKEPEEPNFEQVLYVILWLACAHSKHNYLCHLNAFLNLEKIPDSKYLLSFNEQIGKGQELKNLYTKLVDSLLDTFRKRCIRATEKEYFKHFKYFKYFKYFKKFIKKICQEFDVAFVNLNYDNFITQACPDLFTGFDNRGFFDQKRIYNRKEWNMIYHIHGSVHFNMPLHNQYHMHEIIWENDLKSIFENNADGRNFEFTEDGLRVPNSNIIIGFDKVKQIRRNPFRAYYSQIDKLANEADSILFMGYGFNDQHINQAIKSSCRPDKDRPVIILDKRNPVKSPFKGSDDEEKSRNICSTLNINSHNTTWPNGQYMFGNQAFEEIKNKNVLFWHHGMINACKNYKKIIKNL